MSLSVVTNFFVCFSYFHNLKPSKGVTSESSGILRRNTVMQSACGSQASRGGASSECQLSPCYRKYRKRFEIHFFV